MKWLLDKLGLVTKAECERRLMAARQRYALDLAHAALQKVAHGAYGWRARRLDRVVAEIISRGNK